MFFKPLKIKLVSSPSSYLSISLLLVRLLSVGIAEHRYIFKSPMAAVGLHLRLEKKKSVLDDKAFW